MEAIRCSLLSMWKYTTTLNKKALPTQYSTLLGLLILGLFGFIFTRATGSPLLCLDHFSCQLGQEKKNVACRDNGIDIVPLCLNPSLISLSLHNTRIHMLYVTSFRYYADLKYVNLTENIINRIEKATFENQDKLEELYLADNKISHLESEIFYGLSNLIILSLKGNLLEAIPDGVFQQLPNLEYLDISHNRITMVGNDIFHGLSMLSVLRLSYNRLQSVPSATLKRMPHLAEFSVGGNSFNSFNKNDFAPLRSLILLDISSTDFSQGIDASAFEYLSGLRSLFLRDCQMKSVPATAFSTLLELEELDISRNLFLDIPSGAFSQNRMLHSLTVSGNPYLERISAGALRDNVNLVRIDLSRNSLLAFLPPEDFRFLTRLTFLDLHGNNLQYIPHNSIPWADVTDWYLHDNPITCNCSSLWLRQILIDENHSAHPTVLCDKPPRLSGVPLLSTELSDLSCGLDAATRGIIIAMSVCGLVLIVACSVFLLLYRNRGSCVRQLLKDHKWGGRPSVRRTNHSSFDSAYPSMKPVPVTEL